jgi:hypothetical protein
MGPRRRRLRFCLPRRNVEASGHHGFDVRAPEPARENTLPVVRIEIQIEEV